MQFQVRFIWPCALLLPSTGIFGRSVIAETVERGGEVNIVEEFRILREEFNQKIGVITRKNDMLVKKVDQLVEELLLQKSVEGSTTRTLQDVPFSKVGEDWVADPAALFIFQRGVIIGYKNQACAYGQSVLSVDADVLEEETVGRNCPSGRGSVTFGLQNEASGDWSSVLGGIANQAQGLGASVLGGSDNEASGITSVVMGGNTNKAMGNVVSIAGGLQNTCDGFYNSILGGYKQRLRGDDQLTSPESPFSCTKKMCSTRKNFRFKNLSVKKKFCVKDECQ